MKKLILLTLLSFLVTVKGTMAQQNTDRRTLTTRVADLLLKLPAKDSVELNAYMQEIRNMGDSGLLAMIGMLSPAGKGDNSRLEYAIGGFSFYASQKGKEDWRDMGIKAFCQGLDRLSDKGNQAFILSQLEKVGGAQAVPCLQDYLFQEELCDPAARVLSQIPTPDANEALLAALKEGNGSCRIPIVKALGRNRYQRAVATITPLVEEEDVMLRKSAVFALAQIADPSSEAVLKKAAEKTGFTYDRSEATAAYLQYAENLMNEGNQKQARKIAKELMKKAGQVQYRTAALNLWTRSQGEESLPVLLAALKSEQNEYRVSALDLASGYLNAATLPRWLKILNNSDPEVQVEIIRMLAKSQTKEALPDIIKAISDNDKQVRLAAISAAAALGDEQIFENLLSVLKSGDKEEIKAVKEALLVLKGENLIRKTAAAFSTVPVDAQAALIEVWAHRAARDQWNLMSPYLKHSNPTLRNAAFGALKTLSTQENLPELFSLLKETHSKEEAQKVQEAIMAVLPDIQDQSEATKMVLMEMADAPADQKIHFYKILGSTGGDQSLEKVASDFWNGDESIKKAALAALSSWPDHKAVDELFRIMQETDNLTHFNQAFESHVLLTSKSSLPDAQKLLLLRKAMKMAKTPGQKGLIIRELGKNNTFTALVFAGEFLDDPQLQHSAASSVSSIAMSNKGFHGNIVEGLLKQVLEIQGASAGYQQEFLKQHLEEMPSGDGFVALFNGKDLSGWKGLVGNPLERAQMDSATLAHKQVLADEEMRAGWKVVDGELVFTGKGNNLATQKKYGDFELLVDWKIYDDGHKDGDAGIYLRGTPQVQIWDTSRVASGAQVGSGGLFNNKIYPSIPLKVADNPLGDWNNFHIIMKGDTVTVLLNGQLVTDKVKLENYWDRNMPLFPFEQIELQAHGSRVAYRDIYIRELTSFAPFELSEEEEKTGFKVLFDGTNLDEWTGNTKDYFIENGNLVVRPKEGSGGNFFTKEAFNDFEFRFEFRLTPGANNGLGIRAPMTEDASYGGMELQILDNSAAIYKELQPYQYHGSVYGVLPAKRGYLKPVGEWNYQEVLVKGPKIKVTLNGQVILDGDLSEAREKGTMDGLDHPGIHREGGHIGFLGHDSEVWFRNIRIKDLNK